MLTIEILFYLTMQICSILDTGCGIFVWIGKDADPDDKSHAMIKAEEFIAKNKYPNWTQIHRIVEGAEPVHKSFFMKPCPIVYFLSNQATVFVKFSGV